MILVNGKYTEHIPVTDRGLQYGDGLFETIEVLSGRPIFLQRHIKRLLAGCARLYIPAPSLALLDREVSDILSQASATEPGDYVMKIVITRGTGGRGYRQPETISPSRIISLHPYPDYPFSYQATGIFARFCQMRLAANPSLAGIKHLNRLEQVLARAEWATPDIQEGIMLDLLGYVIEGTMSNVFFIKDNVLHTPLLSQCGVAGIVRAAILELAQRYQIDSVERQINVGTLLSADEVFVTNSIIGIWPVRQLEETVFCIGPITRQLQQWLEQLKTE